MISGLLDFLESMRVERSVSTGDILAFVAILIGVYQFNKQSRIDRKERDLTQRESWFLTVIVEPQLPQLESLYQTLIKDITKQRKSLVRTRRNHNDQLFFNRMAKYKRENNQKIARTFIHLEALVKSYSIALASALSKRVMKLQDICAKLLDRYDDEENQEDIQIRILQHEQAVLALLNKGLTINRY